MAGRVADNVTSHRDEIFRSPHGPFKTHDRYAGSATGAGAALPRIRSEPFSAITMVAE